MGGRILNWGVAKFRGLPKGWFSKRVVFQKGGFGGCSPGKRGYIRMFPRNEKPERGYVRMFPWNGNPERGDVCQNHPFTKPPLCLLSKIVPECPVFWKKGKDPHPQDKMQHLDLTKHPRPLYYKTPPCVFYHKNVRSKAVFGP